MFSEILIRLFRQCGENLLATTLVFILTAVTIVLTTNLRKTWLRGPRGIPVLGFLPFLSTTEPHLQLIEMSKKYGSVFGMYLGSCYTLVLNDFGSIKEAFQREEFNNRPDNFLEVGNGMRNLADMNGEEWKEHRRIISRVLRKLGIGKTSLEKTMMTEALAVVQRLENSCEPETNIREFLTPAVNNIIYSMICGKTYPHDHDITKLLGMYQSLFAEEMLSVSLRFYLPWFRPIFDMFWPKKIYTEKIYKQMQTVVRAEYEEHNKDTEDRPLSNFQDYYSLEVKKSESQSITVQNLIGNSLILLNAGGDTIRNTLEWILLTMAQFPEIQERVYEEMRSVLGDTRPSWNDRDKLPYTQAVITEIQRWKTLLPINVLHCTSQATTFRGCHIPKGSIILSNLYAVHNDSSLWNKPEEFIPERFLSDDGNKFAVPEYYIPFSYGKRICIGEKMAVIEVFLFSTLILQRFKISPPPGGLDMDYVLRINAQCKTPVVRITKR